METQSFGSKKSGGEASASLSVVADVVRNAPASVRNQDRSAEAEFIAEVRELTSLVAPKRPAETEQLANRPAKPGIFKRFSTYLSDHAAAIRESVGLVWKASPKITLFRMGLALGQSLQMFVYGILGSNLFIGLQSAHRISDPKVFLPIVCMLGFKGVMDYFSSRAQSLDPQQQAASMQYIQKTLRNAMPDSIERLRRPDIYKDVQSVNYGIWSLSGAGGQLVQSFGSLCSTLLGAGMLAYYAPPVVGAAIGLSLVYPMVKAVVLGDRLEKHEQDLVERRTNLADISWKRVYPWFARLLNSLGANDAIEQQTESARSEITEREKTFAGEVVKRELVATVLRFGTTLLGLSYLGLQAIRGPAAGGMALQDALFVGMTAIPLLQMSFDQFTSALTNVARAKPVVASLMRLRELKGEELRGVGDAVIDWTQGVPPVEFKNVHFAYPPKLPGIAPAPLFENVSLRVPGGSTVAVVGDNGAGKSTLLQLIDRSLNPVAGEILIGGASIAQVTAKNLFEGLSIHLQSPQQMSRSSFQEFLSWGRAGQGENFELQARIMEATGLAKLLEEKVKDKDGKEHRCFPAGLKTVMGSEHGGIDPSGGELGMLYTTYMLYKQPKIMCLDEPSNGLSQERANSYYEMLFNIKGLLGYKPTIFLVTHDLERSKKADLIVFVDKERCGIAAVGTHDALMKAAGPYAKWYTKSSGQPKAECAEMAA